MDSRLQPITSATVPYLHPQVFRTLFWEMEPSLREQVESTSSVRFEKEAWLAARLWAGEPCGFTIRFNEGRQFTPTATVLCCQRDQAPGAMAMPTAPVSSDAQLITSLFMNPALSGRGVESVLIDAVVMVFTERGAAAVEAFGLRDTIEFEAATAEVIDIVHKREEIGLIDVSALEAAGFEVVRDHPVLPRLRLELPPVQPLLSAEAVEMWLREAELAMPVVPVA